MALPVEVRTTPAPKEKIPFLVKEAAKNVPVEEYLQLRFQRGWDIDRGGYEQIFVAAEVLRKYQRAKGKKPTASLNDELEFSADPRVIGARLILTNVPLATYLVARHEVLKAERNRTTKQKDEYEAAGIYFKDVERLNNRLHNLGDDLELTKKVAEAAGIALDAGV